ncbi:MAG TPA: protoporphyrinogen oxidase [Candidatus Dormibacteraeota bacterium]
MSERARRLAVVGAGISGLAAAAELARLARESSTELELSVFEASARPGGKLLTEEFAGAQVDLGAESLLLREPEILAAVTELGLKASVIRPATTSASIWNGRRLNPIPRRSVLGVPLQPWRPDVIRAIGLAGAARASVEPWIRRGRPEPDGPLGGFLRRRVGNAAFSGLVDPLLGGVYAGPAADLSLGAVAPPLLAAAQRNGSLLRGLRQAAALAAPTSAETPFASFALGLGQLVKALLGKLPSGSIELARPVAGLAPADGGRVRVQTATEALVVDGVVLAVPAPAAAMVLGGLGPGLVPLLRRLEYASVATVTLAYPDRAIGQPLLGSGFLVARRPRRPVTACTFLDRKWPHLRQPGLTILRASAGSFGDEWLLALDDTTLVSAVHRELRGILSLTEVPAEVRVERWHGGLPQYRTGHLEWRARVFEAAAELPAPLVLTGAAFGGVGVASCLREGAGAGRALWASTQPS